MSDVGPGSKQSRKAPPGTDEATARVLEGFDLRDAMIAGVAASANDLAEAANNLVGVARLSRMERAVALTLLVVNTVGVVGIIIIGVLLLNVAQVNRNNTNILRECTTPSTSRDVHECYEDGSARTAKAVTRLGQVQIIVAECVAVGPPKPTNKQFEKCVDDRIAALPK